MRVGEWGGGEKLSKPQSSLGFVATGGPLSDSVLESPTWKSGVMIPRKL